jgi:hypothetical protein
MSNIRWDNLEDNPDLIIKLITVVRRQDKNAKAAVRKFTLAGIKLTYDRVWFSGIYDRSHCLSGRGWNVIIRFNKAFSNRAITMGLPKLLPHELDSAYWLDGAYWRVMKVEITNRDNMVRDITLLRMFDIEEMFS